MFVGGFLKVECSSGVVVPEGVDVGGGFSGFVVFVCELVADGFGAGVECFLAVPFGVFGVEEDGGE